MGRSNIDPVARALALAAAAGGGGGGADAVIIEASANKTVNNYQVPQLTDEQLLQIYNAVVAGKPVTVTDATGSMHFSSLNADSVSGEIFVTMLYFDKMILEYSEGDQTTFTEIGGGSGGLTMDLLWENASPSVAFPAQSILSFDASSYRLFVVLTAKPQGSYIGTPKPDGSIQFACNAWTLSNPAQTQTFSYAGHHRQIYYTAGTIKTFACADGVRSTQFAQSGTNVPVDNTVFVPVRIYGIK